MQINAKGPSIIAIGASLLDGKMKVQFNLKDSQLISEKPSNEIVDGKIHELRRLSEHTWSFEGYLLTNYLGHGPSRKFKATYYDDLNHNCILEIDD